MKKLTKTQVANRRKLVAALRSGKYRQARHQLRRVGGGFCCLGVGCDIVSPNMGKWDGEYFIPSKRAIGNNDDMHEMPGLVAEAFAFDGDYLRNDRLTQGDLAELNDGGQKFSYIADVIETFTEAGL